MRKIAILIALLCTTVGCSNYLLNLWWQDYIEAYKQPPATKEQFDDAMTLFFHTYPESRITRRIYELIYTNSSTHESLEVKKKISLADSSNFEYLFFKSDLKHPNGVIWYYYRVLSYQKNIFSIRTGGWPLEFYGKFNITLLRIAFQKDNYKWKSLGDLTRAESNAAEAEFETDILPKIQECLEIVKERDKAKAESVPER